MIECVLRFKGRDDEATARILSRFYAICEEDRDVVGWGLISKEEE